MCILLPPYKGDGKRIELHNLGRIQSEKARKEIEIFYGLVKAEESKTKTGLPINLVNVRKVNFGRSETKRAITNVLDQVIKNYKFTPLPELNDILKQYNVLADKGVKVQGYIRTKDSPTGSLMNRAIRWVYSSKPATFITNLPLNF